MQSPGQREWPLGSACTVADGWRGKRTAKEAVAGAEVGVGWLRAEDMLLVDHMMATVSTCAGVTRIYRTVATVQYLDGAVQ